MDIKEILETTEIIIINKEMTEALGVEIITIVVVLIIIDTIMTIITIVVVVVITDMIMTKVGAFKIEEDIRTKEADTKIKGVDIIIVIEEVVLLQI